MTRKEKLEELVGPTGTCHFNDGGWCVDHSGGHRISNYCTEVHGQLGDHIVPGDTSSFNAHELTLEFGRFLSEDEWRTVVEAAKQLPFVQSLHANAVLKP